MSAPDPTTLAVATQTVGALAKEAEDFVAAVTGNPGKTIGTILGDWFAPRLKNLTTVTGKAQLTLLNIGEMPKEIPLNILHPAFEAASLQDEPDLQRAWSNLLANAADPRQRDKVEPSFPAMLRELSTREVHFLEKLFTQSNGILEMQFDEQTHMLFMAIQTDQGAEAGTQAALPDLGDFYVMMDVLRRARILDKFARSEVDSGSLKQAFRSIYHVGPMAISTNDYYSFTRLGYRFVRCCRRPEN